MRRGHPVILLALAVVSLLLLTPAAVFGQASGTLDFGTLLREREPETLISSLDDEKQEKKVKDLWDQTMMEGSRAAIKRNKDDIYPNPSLQAYVNRLGACRETVISSRLR
jgi:hypothetical protein